MVGAIITRVVHVQDIKPYTGASPPQKGTEINGFGSLETDSPGAYDDTVLNLLDDLMVNAAAYDIKLLITMYSYNALEGNWDFYGKWYGTGDFYSDSNAKQYFKNRLNHILNHVNPHNNKTWANNDEYIFAFEAQNEPMHDVVCSISLNLAHCMSSC